MHSFLIALQFLTRIPVSCNFPVDGRELSLSVLFYPLVGLLIGSLLMASAIFLANSPVMITAALLLSIWVFLTGALHLDGLADCADAWVGGFDDRQRSFQIMKDPASGPAAVTIITLVLLLKWTALVNLVEHNHLVALLFTPLLGRSAILVLMMTTAYVSALGLADTITKNLPMTALRLVSGISLAASTMALGFIPVFFAALLIIWVRQAANQRLGGVTGDVYGATVEMVETGALVAAALNQ